MRYPEIAAAVRFARLREGVSQERAAATVGASRMQWIRWEQGLHRPMGEFADRLVAEFGVSRDVLVDSSNDDVALALGRDLLAALRRAKAAS